MPIALSGFVLKNAHKTENNAVHGTCENGIDEDSSMTANGEKRVNYSRRFVWFSIFIVAVIVLYSAAWHYASGRVGDGVRDYIASLNHNGQRASCEEPLVRGYPFRIGVFCRSVMFESPQAGVSFYAGGFRSAAQVYQPRHIVGELDGPATLHAPGISALELNWESMRSSIRIAEPLPERFSVESRNLKIHLDEPGDLAPLLAQAEVAEFHARPTAPDKAAVDLALRFSSLLLDANLVGSSDVPPLSGLVDVTLDSSETDQLSDQGARINTVTTIRNATIALDDQTSITLSGTATVDAHGLVDGQLELAVRNPQRLADVLSKIFPDMRQQIQTGFAGMAAMGQSTTLPLTISKGQVRLGFLPLGVIPAL